MTVKKLLGYVPIVYILLRTGVDIASFVSPGSAERAVVMGWPVNQFWVDTTLPAVVTMFVIALNSLKKGYFEEMLVVPMTVVPFYWAATLFLYDGATLYMKVDAVTWLMVGICALIYSRKPYQQS